MDEGLVVNVRPLSENIRLLQTLSQITAGVAGLLSLLALGLAAIGLYGVVAYLVSRRRREVGVRMALGAGARDVQWLFLRQALRPVAIGMAIGVALAAAIVRLLQAVLFGISPYDPIAFAGAPLLMLAIAGRGIRANATRQPGRSGRGAAVRVADALFNRAVAAGRAGRRRSDGRDQDQFRAIAAAR